jgi:hypothetical protein
MGKDTLEAHLKEYNDGLIQQRELVRQAEAEAEIRRNNAIAIEGAIQAIRRLMADLDKKD